MADVVGHMPPHLDKMKYLTCSRSNRFKSENPENRLHSVRIQ